VGCLFEHFLGRGISFVAITKAIFGVTKITQNDGVLAFHICKLLFAAGYKKTGFALAGRYQLQLIAFKKAYTKITGPVTIG
jgi:hypothetical protein